MLRLLGFAALALCGIAVAFTALKVVVFLALLVVAVPILALWSLLDHPRRRHWRMWKDRVWGNAFQGWTKGPN